ncbi:MAG: hypothetical protein IJ366_00465 [Clostridia bacterium]|nr:hypothetical protein [Clostridia bacterium]MBQ7792972.1 hypothetical protein [Clostridia bacterium]
MTETKVYCDRCGKELSHKFDYTGRIIKVSHVEFVTDLCADCFNLFCENTNEFLRRKGGNEE